MIAPTHGAVLDAEGVGPGGYLVKDFADGWYWTPNAALECTDGALVWSVADSRYETEPDRLARPTPEGEATPSTTAPMESEAAPDVSQRAKALSELAALDGETMDLPAQPEPGAGELEVVAYASDYDLKALRTREFGGNSISIWTHPTSGGSRPLTDHTQAQAKIARLEGDVAELTTALSIIEAARVRTSDRALSAEADAALFKTLRDESWDLRCFNIPTGGDDYDIGWRVVGHWQAEPRERTIAEVFTDDPAEAVRQALAAQTERRA